MHGSFFDFLRDWFDENMYLFRTTVKELITEIFDRWGPQIFLEFMNFGNVNGFLIYRDAFNIDSSDLAG